MRKGLLVFLFIFLAYSVGFTQDLRGIWIGYLTGDGPYPNTNYTLNVKTQEGNVVTGRAYIYSEQYLTHEGILDFIGEINKGILKITELSVLTSKITFPRHELCIKFVDLKFSNKNNTDLLTGRWSGSVEEGETDCIPGDAYLKRLQPGQSADADLIPQFVKTELSKDKSNAITFMQTELTKPVIINVNTRIVTLEIKDYMRQDNDTISVYYNRKLLFNRLSIKKQPFIYPVRIERESGLNEIILYANNLGEVPPNTSQLIIRDGKNSQKVNIESTKQNSAVIYLRYSPVGKN